MATPGSENSTDLAISNPALLARFAEMVALLPDADDTGGGMESIVEAILNAKTWEDLDAPWRSKGGEAYLGKKQRIEAAKKRPSDYGQGLGFYVIVDGTILETGEHVTWTTGSTSVVAQLVRAHVIGSLPLFATLHQSPIKSRPGQFAQHLEVHDTGGPGVIGAAPAKPKGRPKGEQAVMDEPAPY